MAINAGYAYATINDLFQISDSDLSEGVTYEVIDPPHPHPRSTWFHYRVGGFSANSIDVFSDPGQTGVWVASGRSLRDPFDLCFTFEGTTAGAPAANSFRADSATASLATEFRVSATDINGVNCGSRLTEIAGGFLALMDPISDAFVVYSIDSVTDDTGSYTLALTVVDSNGAYILTAARPTLLSLKAGGGGGGGGGGGAPLNVTYFLDQQSWTSLQDDANDGLTASTPWATWGKIVDTIRNTPLYGGTMTINVIDAIFFGSGEGELPDLPTPGLVKFVALTDPGYGRLLATANNGPSITIGSGGNYAFEGFNIEHSVGLKPTMVVKDGGRVDLGAPGLVTSFDFFGGSSTIPNPAIAAIDGGVCRIMGNLLLDNNQGDSPSILAEYGGQIDFSQAATGPVIDLTGTAQWVVGFCQARAGGRIILGRLGGVTASFTGGGSITGPRYDASSGGVIETNGAGATFIPGDAPGTDSTGYYL
jgi:hypothetical protein